MANGILFMTLFGGLWAVVGINGFGTLGEPLILTIACILFIALSVVSLLLIKVSRRSRVPEGSPDDNSIRRRRVQFRLILFVELALTVLAVIVLRAVHRTEFIPATIMLIVALHFVPLAVVFRMPTYYPLAALLFLLSVTSLVVVPDQERIQGVLVSLRLAVVGLGGALCLWAFAFINAIKARNALNMLSLKETQT